MLVSVGLDNTEAFYITAEQMLQTLGYDSHT